MASLSVSNITYMGATISLKNLPHEVRYYDRILFIVYQNNQKIFTYTIKGEEDTVGYGGINLDLPYTFSPECTYNIQAEGYEKDGSFALKYSTSFSTPNVPIPTATSIPATYMPVRDQGSGHSCVAETLACAMDIFKAKEADVYYEMFSATYIFGSDKENMNGMHLQQAVDNCIEYGSPRYEIFSGKMPEKIGKSDAVSMFDSASDYVKNNALNQRFQNALEIDFYDCNAIIDALNTYGFVFFSMVIPENFRSLGSSGIVEPPDYCLTDSGHTLALIGSAVIDGKLHWVAQNSWGSGWGSGGRCFLPYDWGCGAQSPMNNATTRDLLGWVNACYIITPGSGYTNSNPSKPYSIVASQVGYELTANITWECDTNADHYVVLARKSGTQRWYEKAYVTTKSANISFNGYNNYQIAVIAINSDYCSEISDMQSVSIVTDRYRLSEEDLGLLNGDYYSDPIVIEDHTIYCYHFQISRNDQVWFDVTPSWEDDSGSMYWNAYLSTNKIFNNENDYPTDFIDSWIGFGYGSFGLDVELEPNTDYYLWIKCTENSVGNTFTLDIYAPISYTVIDKPLGYLLEQYTIQDSFNEVEKYTVYRYGASFENAGTLTVSGHIGNDLNTVVAIGGTTEYNIGTGNPIEYLTFVRTSTGEVAMECEIEANKTYYIWVKNDAITTGSLGVNLTITPPPMTKPSKWDWNISNGVASVQQTKNAYFAITNKLSTANFSYLVWNDLVDKTMDVIKYYGGTWSVINSDGTENYLNYTNTHMSDTDGGKILTADRFNALRFNIGARESTGIDPTLIQKGKPVMGWYFENLVTALNKWIEKGEI